MIPTMLDLSRQLIAIRRQYSCWIVLTNDCEGDEQRAARRRADQIKVAFRFLVARRNS